MRKKLLIALVALNVALIACPLLAAIPFVPQTPALLQIAYAMQNAAPVVSIVSALLAAALLVRSWKAVPALLVIGAAVPLSRTHNLEWIFEPAGAAQTASI